MAKLTPENRIRKAIADYVEGGNEMEEFMQELRLAKSSKDYDPATIEKLLFSCRRTIGHKARFKEIDELINDNLV